LKVAFDEHVPVAMVRVFQALAKERKLKRLAGALSVESAKDYAPKPGDPDYLKRSDVPWVRRFAANGGKVIISGDTNMMREDHERLALIEAGMVVIFFGSQWSGWKFHRKCALLLNWWLVIGSTSAKAKPGSFWRVPTSWRQGGRLLSLPNTNQKLVKIERQKARQSTIAAVRRGGVGRPKPTIQPDLFETAAENDGG
jgi:PIN like domain